MLITEFGGSALGGPVADYYKTPSLIPTHGYSLPVRQAPGPTLNPIPAYPFGLPLSSEATHLR